MKKLIFFSTFCCLFANGLKAQRTELNNAKNEFAKFQEFKQQGYLAEQIQSLKNAQASVDKAILNERTKENATLWAYRSMIYMSLALMDSIRAEEKKTYVDEAKIAVQNAKKFDDYGKEKEIIQTTERNMTVLYQDRGIECYQSKDYECAFDAFKYIASVLEKDTTFNYYAALSAKEMNDTENAKTYFDLAEKNGKQDPNLFALYSRLCLEQKDTVAAIELLQKGRKINPQALNLVYEEANLYIARGKIGELLATLEMAMEKDAENKTLVFVYGVAAEKSKRFLEAEKAYKKALAIDENYFEVNFNLGALFVNQANNILKEANELPDSKQALYLAKKEQFLKKLEEAIPYLEKAQTLNPKDKDTLKTLQEIYARTNQLEKAKKVKEQLERL